LECGSEAPLLRIQPNHPTFLMHIHVTKGCHPQLPVGTITAAKQQPGASEAKNTAVRSLAACPAAFSNADCNVGPHIEEPKFPFVTAIRKCADSTASLLRQQRHQPRIRLVRGKRAHLIPRKFRCAFHFAQHLFHAVERPRAKAPQPSNRISSPAGPNRSPQ